MSKPVIQLRKSQTWPRVKEQSIRLLFLCCAAMSILTTVAIISVLVTGAVEFFSVDEPSVAAKLQTQTLTADTNILHVSGTGEPDNLMRLAFVNAGSDEQFPPETEARADSDGAWQLRLNREGSAFKVTDVNARKDETRKAISLSPGDYTIKADDVNHVKVSEFLTGTEWYPLSGRPKYGVLPIVWDTVIIALIAGLVGLPAGLAIAVYLSEYAKPRSRAIIKPTLEILAGIPTIVYGFFALSFITPFIIQPIFRDFLGVFEVGQFNALSAGIVVGIMIIPMVSSLSEDVLRAVPRGLREAAYALGGTRLDVSARVVVPAALSGITAAFLLALSRAIGETMAVVLAAGMKPNLTLNILDSMQTMTSFIVNITSGDVEVGSAAEKSLYAVGLTLFLMTLLMNLLSQAVLKRFREVYQ